MCLIVDVNISHRVLFQQDDPELCDVAKALVSPKSSDVSLVYGGRLAREYAHSGRIMRVIAQLDRAGRARKVDDALVDDEEEALLTMQMCTSDDPHIIALARVTGTRLLCSA